jgi:membrane-associated protease RseP (regulator of RpoE activity)
VSGDAIAQAVASPLTSDPADAKKAYTDAAVMLRTEMARQRLQPLTPGSPELSHTRTKILQYLEACHRSLEELRRLDKKLPDIEAITAKALAASPALVRTDPQTGGLTRQDDRAVSELGAKLITEGISLVADAWNASSERESYRANYRRARIEALALADLAAKRCTGRKPVDAYGVGLTYHVADDALVVDEALAGGPAAKAGLRAGDRIIAIDGKPIGKPAAGAAERPDSGTLRGNRDSKVKITYSRGGALRTAEIARTVLIENIPLLEIDLDGSWNGIFSADILTLRNASGEDLTNCTLLVDIQGTTGDSDLQVHERHLHYVGRWPADEFRTARYQASTVSGIAGNESVDRVGRIVISLYSDQFRDMMIYEYAGTAAFEEDVNHYIDRIEREQTFSLTFNPDNLLGDAGVRLTHSGAFDFIPDPKVTVTLRQGNTVTSQNWRSNGQRWKTGSLATAVLKHPSFNGMNPDAADLELQYPGSSRKCKLHWDLSKR